MAEAVLIGAGLGAGTSMLSGQDPLKGAAIGGAMGGASAGFGSAGVASGASAGATNGASHLAQTGAEQAASSGMGGISSTIGGGFDSFKDATGLTNRDMSMMAVNQGATALQNQPQQQQIQHAQPSISRPQVDLSQGTPTMNSNPRIKKLQMQGLI
jgi:hypothetical protein